MYMYIVILYTLIASRVFVKLRNEIDARTFKAQLISWEYVGVLDSSSSPKL